MKDLDVKRASVALGLNHHIVGVKLIADKETFDQVHIKDSASKGTVCFHSRQALDGVHCKVDKSAVVCDYGSYALGLKKAHLGILRGESLSYCGLTESDEIGRELIKSMRYYPKETYGFIIGPLDQMVDADVVIIVDQAETIMRVMQGYSYKFGHANHLSFFGNQAVCADLISKPLMNNDINVSLMCKGARSYGRFDTGEMGVSLSIHLFDGLVDGIIKTLNPVSSGKEKTRILSELEDPEELGVKIDMSYSYGKGLAEYDKQYAKTVKTSSS